VIYEAARELAREIIGAEIPPRRIISKLRVLVESFAVCSAAKKLTEVRTCRSSAVSQRG